jgi:hypothetical protein
MTYPLANYVLLTEGMQKFARLLASGCTPAEAWKRTHRRLTVDHEEKANRLAALPTMAAAAVEWRAYER